MFIPDHYRCTDMTAALAWLTRYPFGSLVTAGRDGQPVVTSLPLVAEDDGTGSIRIISHMARRNPHAGALASGQSALLVVNGPNAYVSPRWYENPANVPTWDYVGLQIRGRLKLIEDRENLLDLMRRSIAAFEATTDGDWVLDEAPSAHVDRLIQGVTGFEIKVETLDCMQKLSQNKRSDRPTIQAALRSSRTDYGPLVADLMDFVLP
ncbi:FMN-binding negative transcriptional regulator [Variovorax ginsengisoli]|uniref:Transcriptional regulator n=1 Tax=Variovorax ginsengisoli TaxID=363844 RepID=A0ABT9S8N7_9BURK|nr:FMN-binding negative transcriptional regulator [Variovorax ginsengisoli]MDP9900715.1 transcriptional regulator [Variovorax ginsengisoli]